MDDDHATSRIPSEHNHVVKCGSDTMKVPVCGVRDCIHAKLTISDVVQGKGAWKLLVPQSQPVPLFDNGALSQGTDVQLNDRRKCV